MGQVHFTTLGEPPSHFVRGLISLWYGHHQGKMAFLESRSSLARFLNVQDRIKSTESRTIQNAVTLTHNI